MSTKSQIKDRTRRELKIDPNGDIWSDVQINEYIDDFIGMVYSEIGMDFKELSATLNLVDGTATYSLNSLANYGKLISIKLAGRETLLKEVDKQELSNGRDLTTEGEPEFFYFYGDQAIGLYPVPDGNIATATVDYEREAPVLDSDESPAFNSSWHYVAALYAKARCLASMPGFESQSNIATKNYERAYKMMREDLWERDAGLTLMRNISRPICPR